MNEVHAHAFIRFGLGRRGAEAVPDDPVGWLAAQLDTPDPLLAASGPDIATAFAAIHDYVHPPKEPPAKPRLNIGELFGLHHGQAMNHAVLTDLPFRERLVWFWTNHFCVSLRRGAWVLALIGPYVQEAIRPHVTGRFSDMLRAVMHHAAMLDYLDNLSSTGPDSEYGRRHGRGLNENLARECLELHTVGIDGGYTQADVTSLAMMLTGWTAAPPGDANPGFRFAADRHQPGPKQLMGQSYPDGLAGGEMALMWLACHPATHRHIATKLARHFISDNPPPDAIDRIAAVSRETGGDLRAMTLALLETPEAWQPLTKRRTPIDYVVAVYRALELPTDIHPPPVWVAHALGQSLWGAPLPNGWPDVAAPWSTGEATLRRADWAFELAGRLPDSDAERIGANALGALLSANTRAAIRATASPREAVTMLLASREFQSR
jgi:uncharacterized protein (DUF1800 family)